MEKIITDFLTLYGPLGMGWVVAGILYVGQTRERKQWLEAFDKNTVATTTLVTYLKAKMD